MGTVYGRNGAFVADITGVSKLKSSYFQIKNAKLHYLTAGDSFDFKTKKMSTKKAAISAPSQNGFADSDNILAKYECTVLTHHPRYNQIFNRVELEIFQVLTMTLPSYLEVFW